MKLEWEDALNVTLPNDMSLSETFFENVQMSELKIRCDFFICFLCHLIFLEFNFFFSGTCQLESVAFFPVVVLVLL